MEPAKFHNAEDVQNSIESLYGAHGRGRPLIYWSLLLITCAAAMCLGLVKVDMSVGAPGQVRPEIERLAVCPAVSGTIKALFVADNKLVKKGDILLTIDSTALDAKLQQNQNQQEENDRALGDLSLLLENRALAPVAAPAADTLTLLESADFVSVLPKELHSAQYVRQHAVLLSEIQRLLLQRGKAMQDLGRTEALHKRGLITEADLDQQRYAVQSVDRELEFSLQQTVSSWQSDKIERDLKRIDLKSEAKQLEDQKAFFTVRAPVDGTAIGFTGLNPGLFLPSGQRIGEISPEGSLQADVYVSPRDVGFVRTGQSVNVQVDAFPYTEWGTLSGRVRNISQDFVTYGQQLAFKAVIDLNRTTLRSASGVVVDLRRGMTINARFIVKKRTLFAMLYSTMSDSLDPRSKSATE